MKHKNIKVDSTIGKKMYFLAEDTIAKKINEKEHAVVSVNIKFGMFCIGRKSVIALGLNHMWMKMYYDPVQKSIAWKAKIFASQEELKDGWKLVSLDKQGQYKRSIKKIIGQFILSPKKESYNQLEVKRYKDYSVAFSEEYYYVELK